MVPQALLNIPSRHPKKRIVTIKREAMKKVGVAAQLRGPNQKQGELGLNFKPIQAMSLRTKALIVPLRTVQVPPLIVILELVRSVTSLVRSLLVPLTTLSFKVCVRLPLSVLTWLLQVQVPLSVSTFSTPPGKRSTLIQVVRLSDTRNLSRSHGCVVPLALLLVRTLQVFLPKGFLLRPSRATKKFEMEKHCAGRAV